MAEYDKTTKEENILNYLQQGHELTCRDAIDLFNVNYLPHYIHNLVVKGYNIQSIRETNPNTKTHYYRYKLVDNELNDLTNGIKRAKQFKNLGKDTDARAEALRVIAQIQQKYY